MSSPHSLRLSWIAGSILMMAAVVIVITTLIIFSSSPQTTQAPGPATSGQPTPEQARALNAAAASSTPDQIEDPGPLPRALAGARPDIQLRTDANGNLIIDPQIKILFEFFLAGIADEPLETVLARIQHALAEQLHGAALAQARDLLRRYVDYKIAIADLEAETPPGTVGGNLTVTALSERLQRLQDLRSSHFNREENQAFFELDQVQDDYMLRHLAITQNGSLSEQERQQALRELDQQLPAPVREVRERVTRHGELYATTESMRNAGASEEEIYRVRAQAFGREGAENLAKLDQERAAWQQRLNDYIRERDTINQSGLSPEDRATALGELIESRFDEREQLRVMALTGQL